MMSIAPGPFPQSEPIECEQLFSKKAMGFLWSKRTELDTAQVKMLDALFKGKRKGTLQGSFTSKYAPTTTSISKRGYGRLVGSLGSLERLEREIRGTLCNEYYHDVDVVNCHPVLLVQFAKRYYNEDMKEVEQYCLNRDEYLGLISDNRDVSKTAVISVLYGGSPAKAFLKPMYDEIQRMTIRVMADPVYSDLLAWVAKQGGNTVGSFLSYVLQTEERRVMMALRESLQKRNWSVDVLAYDGVQVRKSEKLKMTDDLLREVETDIEQVTGYRISLAVKPFDTLEMDEEEDTRRVVGGDKDAADMLYEELKSSLVYCRGHFYSKVNNVWVDDEEVRIGTIRRYVMDADLWLQGEPDARTGKPKLIPYSQKLSHSKDCTTAILDLAVTHRNDLWESQAFESSRGKVLFTNGYYDVPRGIFVPTTSPDFDPDVVFMASTGYDFDMSLLDQGYMENIRRRLFDLPFGDEMGHHYLLRLARGASGDKQKKFIAGIGSSNTGKSAISSALKHALGHYYGAWNAANMCYKPNSSQDEAQKQRWIYLLRYKRIIVSNELTVGGLGLDGNMLKKLSNGGMDDITAREHQKNEQEFQVAFLPLLFAQDLDRIRPMDDAVMTRLEGIHYQKVYVDEPSNEYELKIDRGLDQEVQTMRFRVNLMALFFETYKLWHDAGRCEVVPECVKVAVKEVVGTETNIIDSFLSEFEITGNPEDFVRSSDIEEWMKRGKYHVTMTKLGLELKKHITINKLEGVESKVKKMGGKPVRGWAGIRVMTEDA